MASSIFSKSFFSVEGQKERLINVGKVLGISTGLYNPTKDKLKANTDNQTLNKVLETTASHPFITAGAVAVGYTAATKIAAGATAGTAAGKVGAVSSGSLLKTAAIAGGVGVVAGSLFSKGASTAPQSSNINPNINPQPKQDTSNKTDTSQRQQDNINQSGTGNKIFANKYQYSTQTSTTYQYPQQNTPISTPITTEQQQTASGSSNNTLLIAAAAIAAVYLLK